VNKDETSKGRCHCFAIPNAENHKNKSPLSQQPTSAVDCILRFVKLTVNTALDPSLYLEMVPSK
jgi:hypothetical protein